VELFLVQRLGKAADKITLISGDIQISYLLEKYSPALGGFVPPRIFGTSEGTTPNPMHWLEVLRTQ